MGRAEPRAWSPILQFATDGLKVIVAGRTGSAIRVVAADIARTGGQTLPGVADATSESDVAKLFDAAGDDLDLAISSAGDNTAGKIVDMEADHFERSWRVVCFGGFPSGREAIRRMLPKKLVTILLTGASARGRSGYGAKAGLRVLARRWRRSTPKTEFTSIMSTGQSRGKDLAVVSRKRPAGKKAGSVSKRS